MARHPEKTIQKLIPQIAREQNFVKYESKIESISSGGANYATVLFTVILSEGEKVLNMFAKVASAGDQMRQQTPKIYENEIFAYTKLMRTYQKLEEENRVPQEYRLSIPKFYGYDPTLYEETVVLENLILSGYEPYDRFKSINWEYSKAALNQLAQMHALAFAYSTKYPEEFNQVLEDRVFKWNADGSMSIIFKMMLDKAVGVTRDENKDKLLKYFENYELDTFLEYYTRCRRKVLGHGDFRPSNLMHRKQADNALEIKIVDFQTLQGTSPVIDLLYFIFIGSDEQFRAQYYDRVIEHYYVALHAAMKRLHLNPEKVYSKADFKQELKEKLPFGITIAVFALPVVTVAKENAPKVDKDMNMESFNVENTSELYASRVNGVDNALEIKIVDFQTLQGTSPVIDLLYFIFIGSDEQFRAQYYDRVIEHYYVALHAAMKRLHLNPEKVYSKADFKQELKEKLPFGITIAVFALPVVTVAEENAPKVDKDMNMASFNVENTSELYASRMNGVVNDYIKWGILK